MKSRIFFGTLVAAVVAGAAGTGSAGAQDVEELRELANALFEPIPEGLVEVDGAVPTEEQIELGKMLWFEPRLSVGHNISCNTCHNLGTGGADLAPVSLGHRWQRGGRNSPTVLNAVFNTAQFWDGRAADLAEQAGGPIENPVEMASNEAHAMEVINSLPGYHPYFEAAYPDDPEPISFTNLTHAIAMFEVTLTTPNAPFDLWLKGDDDAMDEQEVAGLQTFIDAGCATCHNDINLGGNSYQPFGVVERPGWAVLPPDDRGRFEVTRSEHDDYVFKVPTLRNIALTPPYFHSGSVWSLEDSVAIMSTSQLGTELNEQEIEDITAFMHALTGDQPIVTYPILPPNTAETPPPQQ
ncbi:MAG TPA: cytochrome-c peroxidase [Kiloniellales bacterium]|nr:cytochrome-c peroxidase [Kiloniellales bacterium]